MAPLILNNTSFITEKLVLPVATAKLVSLEQPMNAPGSIVVTVAGIV